MGKLLLDLAITMIRMKMASTLNISKQWIIATIIHFGRRNKRWLQMSRLQRLSRKREKKTKENRSHWQQALNVDACLFILLPDACLMFTKRTATQRRCGWKKWPASDAIKRFSNTEWQASPKKNHRDRNDRECTLPFFVFRFVYNEVTTRTLFLYVVSHSLVCVRVDWLNIDWNVIQIMHLICIQFNLTHSMDFSSVICFLFICDCGLHSITQ